MREQALAAHLSITWTLVWAIMVLGHASGGKDLEPPPPHGPNNRSMSVKLTSVAEIDTSQVRCWIEQTAHAAGWVIRERSET